MLRKDGRSSPSDRQSVSSRRNRGADAKSSMGSRVSRTNAVPVTITDNDIRCVVTRYDMVMSNDARRGLALFAGGKHGVVSVRSALSGASPASTATSGASQRGSRVQQETTAADSVHRKHGTTVVCMELVTHGEAGSFLWCGLSDGSVQVFRAAAASNATALSQPPSPRSITGLSKQTFVQQATTKCLVFEARHHNGSVICMASSEFAVFTGGADWKINRWNSEEPFGVLGCVGTHSLAVRCLHVTGRALISGGDDSKVKVWPFTTVEKPSVLEGHTAAVLTCVTHRGLLWTAGEDATIRLWAIEGDRRCLNVVTTHRTPVVSLQAYDSMMVSFDKGGNALVWDLNKAPNEIEALHCYQTLGGVQPPAATIRSTSASSSRSPSEASANFAPSVARSVASASSASAPKALPIASPVAIHDVRLVANVHGFIAWVFTNEGAKLSFLPLRSIEEELEVKYSDRALGDGFDDMSSSAFGVGKATVEDLQRQLEDAQQREERQNALMEDLQEEFAEFAEILAEDLAEMLTETLDLFTVSQSRAQALFGASVAAVQNQTLRNANNVNKKAQDLEHQVEELNGKLAERARQLAQANAKASTLVAAKQEEITKINIELQRAQNENKQLQYEVKAAKENVATLETMMKRHEAKLDKAARTDVESVQLRAELKMTKEALERLQQEASRQAEEAARQRAKVMGDDASRVQILEDLEKRLAVALHAQAEASAQARTSDADLRGRVAQVEDLQGEIQLLQRRLTTATREMPSLLQGDELTQDLQLKLRTAELEIDGLRAQLRSARRGAAGNSLEGTPLDTSLKTPTAADSATEVASLTAQVAEKQQRIEELEGRLKDQAQQVLDMQTAVRTLQETLMSGGGKSLARRASGASAPGLDQELVEQLRKDVADRDATIADLQAKLREKEALLSSITAQPQQVSPQQQSPRRLEVLESPPRQDVTHAGGSIAAPVPVMSPMERLSFDMDADDEKTARHAVTSPAAATLFGIRDVTSLLDATPYQSRPTATRLFAGGGTSANRLSTLGSRSGLMALRDAERILGTHRMSLSGAAHSLALSATIVPSNAPPQNARRGTGRESPTVVAVTEEADSVFEVEEEKDDEELSRLFRIIDRTQTRLRQLERSVATAASEEAKEAMLKEIAVLHDTLTSTVQPDSELALSSPHVSPRGGGTASDSAVPGKVTSVLDAARLRLAAAERVRAIREMPMFGPGSPRRDRQ